MKSWWLDFTYNRERERAYRQAQGPLAEYLQQPFTSSKTPCNQLRFAALDFETTGLDVKQDKLLSIGLVPFDFQGIPVEQSWHQIIQSPVRIPETSAVLHGITDDASATGTRIRSALAHLLKELQRRILVTHHSVIELSFLTHLCRQLYGADFICINIDTERLARRFFSRSNTPIGANGLRLYKLRECFGLPRYKAHNAHSDALATAELFLALSASATAHKKCQLKDFL